MYMKNANTLFKNSLSDLYNVNFGSYIVYECKSKKLLNDGSGALTCMPNPYNKSRAISLPIA